MLWYIIFMNYTIKSNKIIINNTADFNPKHICECGQMFRFFVDENNNYTVVSGANVAKIVKSQNGYEILTDNPQYFVKYFDLDFDYAKAKQQLSKYTQLKPAIDAGGGIRVVNGDPIENIFEFIISANNNIKRIQKIVEKLCEIGDDINSQFGRFKAFPSVEKLASMPLEWYNTLGAGYRAKYLKETAEYLKSVDISEVEALPSDKLYKWLINLKGVGPKVASCILLFGFSRREYFPVDTWVEQVYNNHFYQGDKTRKQIQEYFQEMFGNLSGIAQQYLFNMERTG